MRMTVQKWNGLLLDSVSTSSTESKAGVRGKQQCAKAGSCSSLEASLCLLLRPHAVTSHRQLQISHDKSLYTMEIGKCYKPKLFFPR